MAHVVAGGDLAQRFVATVAALDRLALLVRGELRLAAQLHAARHGARPAFAGARADQLALELGQAAQDGQHQPAMCCGGVGPCVAQGPETGFAIGDRGEGVQQVACRSRETIKARDRYQVAGLKGGEQAAKLRAVGLCPARDFAKNFRAACLGELAHLRRGALAVRRYPRIAVNHARILHQNYAPEKRNVFSGLVLVHNS